VGFLHGLFMGFGLVLALVLFYGLLELDWPPRIALLTVVVAALTPGWIVYENWLFYDFPVLVLLAVACLGLFRFSRTGQWTDLVVFVAAVTSVTLTRSLFHLVWAIGSIGMIAFLRPRLGYRQALVVFALPLVLIGGWYAKNGIVFGFFGSSSWLGFSLAKTATAKLEPVDREAMVAKGEISSFALVTPFSPLERYESAAGVHFQDSGVAALSRRFKSSGAPNFNHRGFVDVSDRCRKDALRVIRVRPAIYGKSVFTALRRFFSSSVAFPPFLENLVVMAPIYYFGEMTWDRPVVVGAVFLGVLLFSFFGTLSALRQDRRSQGVVRLWVLWTLLWVLVVGSLVEIGENHRFRFMVTPLVWLTLADAGRRMARMWGNRKV